MSDTPKTDAFEKEYYWKTGDEPDVEEVIFEFCRKLERQTKKNLENDEK